MADAKPAPTKPSGAATPAASPEVTPAPTSWREVWQAPALLVAGGLLLSGVVAALFTSAKPDFSGIFHRAERMIEDEQFPETIQYLNSKIAPYVAADAISREQIQLFHKLRARSVYLAQSTGNLHDARNDQTVIEELLQAERAGATLDGSDLFYLADSYVSIGDFDRAMSRRNSFPEGEEERKNKIVRRIVDKKIAERRTDYEVTLELISEYLASPSVSGKDRAWALARQGELLMRQGFVDRAITLLVQGMIRFRDVDPELQGELHFLLGRAYIDSGAMFDAMRQLQLALDVLGEADARRAEVLVMMARLMASQSDADGSSVVEASRMNQEVLANFQSSPAVLPALLGIGEIAATQLDLPRSLEVYRRLVEFIKAGRSHPDATPDAIAHRLLAHWQERFDAGDVASALQFAWVAESLPAVKDYQPAIDLAIAKCRKAQAEALLASLDRADPYEPRTQQLARLDPATREEARRYFIEAGRFYRKHADAVALSDNASFGESLWQSGDCFDRAGDQDTAIAVWKAYLQGFSGDPRLAEASFRLAQAYQAKGDYDMAATLYQSLIRAGTGDGLEPGLAAYADLSQVPLAQTLLMDGNPTNDEQAEQLLEQVVDGQLGGPDTRLYRDALLELAKIRETRGDHERAIKLLEEALVRSAEGPDSTSIGYDLALSYRHAAQVAEKRLTEALPDHERQTLVAEHAAHLRRAMMLFARTRAAYEHLDTHRLGAIDSVRARNSGFFEADCAYDLGEYAAAIQLYEASRERYPTDPASLVSMMQVVNAYLKQGDRRAALAANERARRFYQSLPANVWSDPTLPMSQNHWKNWLDANTSLLASNDRGPNSRESSAVPEASPGGTP